MKKTKLINLFLTFTLLFNVIILDMQVDKISTFTNLLYLMNIVINITIIFLVNE